MLAVTGIGMVSALSLDAVSSCAAARASINRIVQGDDLFVDDLNGDETAPVAVHRVPRISAGLFGFARLLRLGLASFDDLIRTTASLLEGRLAIILIVDGGHYQEAWSRRVRERAGAADDESENDTDFLTVRNHVVNDLLSTLIQRADLDIPTQLRATLGSSGVGLIAALQQAADWLTRGACDRCIVAGIDSLIDPSLLVAIDGLGLLRTPNRAVGMMPGEASCFIALERPRDASARRAPIHAILESPAVARESAHPLLDDKNPGGGGLVASISETLSGLPDRGEGTSLAVVNLNGDAYRATSWSRSIVALNSPLKLGSLPLWIPPLSFGDIGAATGPVSVALLTRGWARGYAPGSNALLCLLDDGGGRGTVYVRAPGTVDA